MVVRLVAFTAADRFFNLIVGRRRNELRNAAGLVLKLRIFVAVQDLIISFYTQKVQFISVPPPLLASAPLLRLLWRRHWLIVRKYLVLWWSFCVLEDTVYNLI